MPKSLVIVESPAKAKTINKFLGSDFVVQASGGHIMDLPKTKMGVNVENGFTADYVVIPERKKILTQIKKDAKKMKNVYLAADPDREGEAICWHIKQNLVTKAKIFRVIVHEITEQAVKEAFAHPGSIDIHKVEAQQARRILDRLVGYSLSPLLWRKISRGLSAGRVQSVAVRIIVEREREIGLFVPEEYWEIEALLKKQDEEKTFLAKLDKIGTKKPTIKTKEQADKILMQAGKEKFIVSDIQRKEKRRNPQAPHTTSKLQQDAFNQLHFSASRTMRIAQQLYEGLEIGKEESVGLITYMRTDSVRVSTVAQKAARDYICAEYGDDYLPPKPPKYKSKKSAQEAHEAIRPTLPLRAPDTLKEYLSPDQYKLYSLIWDKFLSSQMKPAIYAVTSILINAGVFVFKTVGSTIKFAGFLKALNSKKDEEKQYMPEVHKGEELDLIKLDSGQHFTQPPARYSDATLVKALEEKGIGRPSTYAPIMQTIIARDYVRRDKGYLFPTELGFTVNDLLTKFFSKIVDVEFTAKLEGELDEVEEGKQEWVEVVKLFYAPFIEELSVAQKKVKKEVIPTNEVCELCGKPMVIKWGRHGRFLSCSGFPKCKSARSITTEVRCPEKDCDGWLVERRSRRGRVFYGCSKYPKCKYITNKLP
ncbi:MAG: type I DNA topoisomerase [Candidatus Omnitrophica bacterium]|nr:type I DNA topoisomerase [Candidatus Omnitrophota bacterium]